MMPVTVQQRQLMGAAVWCGQLVGRRAAAHSRWAGGLVGRRAAAHSMAWRLAWSCFPYEQPCQSQSGLQLMCTCLKACCQERNVTHYQIARLMALCGGVHCSSIQLPV